MDITLPPRHTVVMSTNENEEIKRLLEENAHLRKANEDLHQRSQTHQDAAEALERAIATLKGLSKD